MEKNLFEKIEQYILGLTTPEENTEIENLINSDPEVRNLYNLIMLDIIALNHYWLNQDQKKINNLKNTANYSSKRFGISIAAMIAVVLIASAMVFTPVYKFVVEPIINEISHKSEKELVTAKPSIIEEDYMTQDSILVDTVMEVTQNLSSSIQSEVILREQEEDTIMIVSEEEIEEIDTDVSSVPVIEKKPITQIKQNVMEKVTTNEIITTNDLMDYTISPIRARRDGDKVICSFTMENNIEDAEIQMHSARARDGESKLYNAKYCLLNGKNSRIIEKWKRGEEHTIEITIKEVPIEIKSFTNVSFSFQSKGKSNNQKSKSIVLQVGDIK